jgi:hypothetical protein
MGVMPAGRSVANVHSSNIGGEYPSEVSVVNKGSAAAPITFGVFNAHTGARIGTYNGGTLAPGTGRALSMIQIERAMNYTPPQGLTHYVVTLEGPMTGGELQHFVFHQPTQVLADLTPVCALPLR